MPLCFTFRLLVYSMSVYKLPTKTVAGIIVILKTSRLKKAHALVGFFLPNTSQGNGKSLHVSLQYRAGGEKFRENNFWGKNKNPARLDLLWSSRQKFVPVYTTWHMADALHP